ncbi:MAG: nucleotidyltransferase domain-containing protein [Roseibium sp.]|uniref:nucleotidyltransferase domain-containing protein n=1 Tax=Roseibium sp. TaxID=1936156 RepID=UPI002637FAEA|nr:nucleotidyltransferase domain-containing protein [Roseibium sp.]MCV0428646.1 nucleotidyltransferase domain-containing protein [Roseibium sp.]
MDKVDRRLLSAIEVCRWSDEELEKLATFCEPFYKCENAEFLPFNISTNSFGSFNRQTADRYSDLDCCIVVSGFNDQTDALHILEPLATWLSSIYGSSVSAHENGFSLSTEEILKPIDIIPIVCPDEVTPDLEMLIFNKGRWLKTRALYQNAMFNHARTLFEPLPIVCRLARHLLRSREPMLGFSFPGFVIDTTIAKLLEQNPTILRKSNLILLLLDAFAFASEVISNYETNTTYSLGFSSFLDVLGKKRLENFVKVSREAVEIGKQAGILELEDRTVEASAKWNELFCGNIPSYETYWNKVGWGRSNRAVFPGTDDELPVYFGS